MAKRFYEKDGNLAQLQGKTVAIIGYGSQGHAHALESARQRRERHRRLARGKQERGEGDGRGTESDAGERCHQGRGRA